MTNYGVILKIIKIYQNGMYSKSRYLRGGKVMHKKKKAFTLIEVIAAIAILAIALAGILEGFTVSNKLWARSNGKYNNTNYAKSIVEIYKAKLEDKSPQISLAQRNIGFNNEDELNAVLEQIKSNPETAGITEDTSKIYSAKLQVKDITSNEDNLNIGAKNKIYKLIVTVKNRNKANEAQATFEYDMVVKL